MSLEGKVAFITGAARGQGRAHAVRLAQDGADVVISDICGPVTGSQIAPSTKDDLDETVRLVEATGRRVLSRVADVRELEPLIALADDTMAEFGRIDVVVANAGVLAAANAWEMSSEMFRGVVDVNLVGVFHTIRATVPHMIAGGRGGSIILTSSTAGLKGQPFTLGYTASKHGVVGLCRGLANELGEYNIRVNTIHPAGVLTEMTNVPVLFQMITEKATTLGPLFMNTIPEPPMMQPEDISAVVSFLASDAARYLTGAQIPIDLGMTNR